MDRMGREHIPIITFHQGGQQYLLDSLNHNKKYGEVVLIGDERNRGYTENWVNTADISKEWDRFRPFNTNYSYYEDWYWDSCLSLYFYIKEYLIKHIEINKFIHIESDCLLYRKPEEVNNIYDYDFGFPDNGKVGNIAVAFFSRESFFHLCDYMENLFINNRHILEELWTKYKKNHDFGGISDMTMLHMWLESNPPFRFKNMLDDDFDNAVVIENIAYADNKIKNEYKFNKFLMIKKTKFIDGEPWHFKTDGRMVKAFNVHCIGGNKIYVKAFAMGKLRLADYWNGYSRYIENGIKNRLHLEQRGRWR